MGKFIDALRRPAAIPVYILILLGILIGGASAVGFNQALEATNTQEFCTSCHIMAEGPFVMLQDTTHFKNESGMTPACSDCHVPQEFIPKMWRKIQAAREVWSTVTGKIDTREKYLEHVPVMKAREIARMRANDSQECRNCHEVERMLLAEQSVKARQFHQAMMQQGGTCIDCHQGLAHMSPAIAERLEQALSESH